MCGIAGFIDKKNKYTSKEGKKIIQAMINSLKHRGPDDQGIFNEKNVYLGQTRLSIIDLSKQGHQPMIDDEIKLIFNGEIYNYQETKSKLKKYKFKTKTDTEAIIKAYREWGFEKSVSKHKGMFAFVLFNSHQNLLHIAIDRFGIKPLYIYEDDNFFAFASEIKALLKIPGLKAELNKDHLWEYLCFRHLADPNTLFKNIYKIPAASLLTVNLKPFKIKTSQYWQLKKIKIKKNNYLDQLDHLLKISVKQHLIADAPIGLQLSGGVDSSLVAALASKYKKNNFHSFSIGLTDPKWNEFKYSNIVAKKIKSQHHQYIFNENDFCKLLPKLTYYFDEPINHSHSVPMYILAKKARKYVKVLMSGEGADEIFGGYNRYKNLPAKISNRDLIFKNSFAQPSDYNKIIKLKVKNNFNERLKISKLNNKLNSFDQLSILDQKTYLISMLLRQDKMGMAASLENRVPFLDHELVEFIYSLPTKEKIKNHETKYILKKIAEKYVSKECLYRPKVGFGQPTSQWLKNRKGLGKFLQLLLTSKRDFIDYKNLKIIINQHLTGKKDHGQILWILINLELWLRTFIDKKNYEKI